MPSEIGLLTGLKEIVGNKLNLSGTLPTEIGLLTGLYVLNMNVNNFHGHFPTQLGELTELRNFHLFRNSFSGSLPTELGQMTQIECIFTLSETNLTGPIPSELVSPLQSMSSVLHSLGPAKNQIQLSLQGLLTAAHTVDLSKNYLTGTVPVELGNLYGLTSLQLHQNQLSGPIPSELGLLDSNPELVELPELNIVYYTAERNISKIGLWGNALTGTVPLTLSSLSSLQLLEIYNNTGITGSIPSTFCDIETWSDKGGIQVDCEYINCTCPSTNVTTTCLCL